MVCLLGSSSQESEGVGRHDEEKEGCPCLYKEEYVKFCKNLFLYIVRGHHHAYTGLVLLHTGRDTGKENGTPAAIQDNDIGPSLRSDILWVKIENGLLVLFFVALSAQGIQLLLSMLNSPSLAMTIRRPLVFHTFFMSVRT